MSSVPPESDPNEPKHSSGSVVMRAYASGGTISAKGSSGSAAIHAPASARVTASKQSRGAAVLHALANVCAAFRKRRGGGPKKTTPQGARQRLIKLADQADLNGDEIEPYTLSKYTTRSPRTVYYWLARATWGIEDLRIQLRRYRQRQAKRI